MRSVLFLVNEEALSKRSVAGAPVLGYLCLLCRAEYSNLEALKDHTETCDRGETSSLVQVYSALVRVECA